MEHASHFKESRTDLSMRVDLEGGAKKNRGVFELYPRATEREVERLYWKRAVVGLGVALMVLLVIVVVLGVALGKKRS